MAQRDSELPDGFIRTVGLNRHRKCEQCGAIVNAANVAAPINADEVGFVNVETHECGDGGDARIAGNDAAPAPSEMGDGPTTRYTWDGEEGDDGR